MVSKVTATAQYNHIARLFVGWPTRADTWPEGGKPARTAITAFVRSVVDNTQRAEVVVVAGCEESLLSADAAVDGIERAHAKLIAYDDCWLQDIGPVWARGDDGALRGVGLAFSGWGGGVCYADYRKDAAFAHGLCAERGVPLTRCELPLEGGALCSDGTGTVLMTRECAAHRGLSESQVESALRDALGVRRVVWLPQGAAHDADTHGHVDNIAVFTAPARVALLWADEDADSEQHHRSAEALRALRDAGLTVHKIAAPPTLRRTEDEARGVTTAAGTKRRPAGEALCASYTNFVVVEDAVFAPRFGVPHDDVAHQQLQAAFAGTGKKVVMVNAREVVLAGGGLHCVSLGEPSARLQSIQRRYRLRLSRSASR